MGTNNNNATTGWIDLALWVDTIRELADQVDGLLATEDLDEVEVVGLVLRGPDGGRPMARFNGSTRDIMWLLGRFGYGYEVELDEVTR